MTTGVFRILACLKIEEITDFLPEDVNFKEKTTSNTCHITMIFDTESGLLWAKRRFFNTPSILF